MAIVLLIDDEPEMVHVLNDMVIEIGHTPITVTNARDALALTHTLRPHLIMSTIALPLVNGLVCLATLQTDAPQKVIMAMLHAKINAYIVDHKEAWCLQDQERANGTAYQQTAHFLPCTAVCRCEYTHITQHEMRRRWLLWQPL